MPRHDEWEEQGQVPREAWHEAGEAGLLCCNVSEEYGGLGGDFLHSTIVLEELAKAGATAPSFSLHSDIVAPYLEHFGSEAVKRKWLPKMATGAALAAVAMTEPSGGSDLQAIRTSAVKDGDEYVLNGQKVFITNAQGADIIVVACKTDPSKKSAGVSLILVETDRHGFKRGRKLEKIGCRGQDTSELFFSDVRVPSDNLIGVEGNGFRQLMQELPQERLTQAIRSISAAEGALQWTIEYTSDRKAFGRRVADFQNTQFKLAEMHAEIVASRVFVDRCIELHMQSGLDAIDAAIAKMTTTELLGRVTDQCLQLFGGWGYMREYPIARAFVDARMARIAAGSSEIMRHIIGRSLIPKPETDG